MEPTGFLATKVFIHLPEHKSVSNAAIAFAISGLLLFVDFISIFSIVTSPGKFCLIFTLTIISLLVGLAHWNGPQAYMNKMFEKQNIVKTLTLLSSMFCSLLFSLVWPSYLLSLFFCIVEFNAIMLYFCNTFPIGKTGGLDKVKSQAAAASVKASAKGLF